MLARYRMVRGKRPLGDSLPDGIRVDTRKHTRHVLRPSAAIVVAFLSDASDASFDRFALAYSNELEVRFSKDRTSFDALAKTAAHTDVYLGCSCPSKANPDVKRCHTVLALAFMKKKYPRLTVVFPK